MELLDQLNVMTKEELLSITGGGMSATLVNAVVRFASMLLELGRTLGSIINRTTTKNIC